MVPITWVEAERYRGLGVPADRLTRIAPGVEPLLALDRAAILASLGIPAQGRFIVVSGNLDHDAGMKLAVWAFDLISREFKDLYLVILGEGPARAALDAYGRSTMYDDYRVRFAGNRADGANVIAAADLAWVVHPHGDVRFALEAMSAGVPPVILGHGGNPEMVRNGETGLVVDEAHYGAALAHLRHHPEERARLGANAARESAASLDGRRSALRLHALLAEASALGWTSPHRAEHAAGPFAAAQRFADALGGWGDAFRRSLQGDRRADDAIRATSIDAARTEGGLFHHRNAEPDDGVLRYWAALVLEGHGRMDAARAEFAAARALGAPGEDPVTGLAPHGRSA